MLTFSKDPDVAEEQMRAIIFYLTAFGYIDGDFDLSEKTFIKIYIRKLVEARASQVESEGAVGPDVITRFVSHFHEVFEEIDHDIRELFTEVVAESEEPHEFVYAKLKLRSYEIFKSFDESNRRQLLQTVDELINADGKVHPSEEKFRDEVFALINEAVPDAPEVRRAVAADLHIEETAELGVAADDHPFFANTEHHYSSDPVRIRRQAEGDYRLIVSTMKLFDDQREAGRGKLNGASSVADFKGGDPFLDGHVYVEPLKEGMSYELTVLGDLHGCYSCLKAALMQADFFAKIEAFRLDPQHNPNPKLILLGDYIDRGRFSYNGVLRTVMQLVNTAPDHVYMLRGNHEYYLEYKGRIYGGVRPAEAINSLVGYMPNEMFEAYMKLFESMPNMLLLGSNLFVHAGIPRDAALREKYRDLSSLNDEDLRFQMLWSDPSTADFIPEELQAQNARFPFGRLQLERFMSGIGCTTLVRGHEKITEGFKTIFPDGAAQILNIFSAGGAENGDLPVNSSYRQVTPMAVTMAIADGKTKVTPWVIEYERFNDPERNQFFAKPPEIAHKAE